MKIKKLAVCKNQEQTHVKEKVGAGLCHIGTFSDYNHHFKEALREKVIANSTNCHQHCP